MKQRKSFILSIVIILLLITGYTFLRAYVDRQPFLIAFDHVVSAIISEFWKFISNPVIFASLIAGVLIYNAREKIMSLFPAIREISAGGISAKLDFQQVGSNVVDELGVSTRLSHNQQELITETILSNLREETLLFLLYMNKKSSSLVMTDLYPVMEQYKVGVSSISNYDALSDTQQKAYLAGSYFAFKGLTFRYVFDFDKEKQTYKIKPKALQVITELLEKKATENETNKPT